MPASVAELSWIETADGQIYEFNDSGTRFALTAVLNGGLPDQRFFTRLPYRGDREIETDDPRLNPRSFSMDIRNVQENRDDFWAARTDLLDAVRPNRGGQPLFVFQFPDESQRAIYVRPQTPNYEMDSADEWSEFSFSETMRFQAFDPVWFDPTLNSVSLSQAVLSQLVFPITFDDDNIFFSDANLFGQASISYVGNWYSYPTVVIGGPFDGFTVIHQDLGLRINYNQARVAGQSVTVDLNNRSYTDNNGNKIVLHPVSNIVDFKIESDPLVANGLNTLEVLVPGAVNGVTTVSIQYYTRWIGI